MPRSAHMLVRPSKRATLLAGASALLGAGAAALLLRKGVVLGPDSWAYWEGSVSLLERGQYTYFGGVSIFVFPPLFSCVLALFQAVLGISARSLAVALATCVAAGSAAWLLVYLVLTGRRERVSLPDLLAVLYVPATLAITAQTLLSEALWLVLLPSLLVVVIAPDRPGLPQSRGVRPLLAWLLLSGMLLCRNATLALLPAVFFLYASLRTELPLRRRIATAAALTLGSLLPWYGVLRFLGQLGERGGSQHGLVEYARQALSGLAYAFGPQRGCVGALLLCGLALTLLGERRRELVALMTLTALGMLGLVLLFSTTYVAEPLAGRFVVFAAISFTLVSLAAWQPPARGWRRRSQSVLGVLVTAVALYRVGVKARLAGVEQPVTPLDVTLSSTYWKGPPRMRDGYVLVAPPTYSFLTREPPR